MKNNLVKILATLGLIVAIALILKGVFGVGKIGLKKVSKNNTIIFDQCYDPNEFSSYEKAYPSDWFEKWNFKINLDLGTVVRTMVRKDETIQKFSENGVKLKKVELENFYVKSSTDTYIETKPLDQIWYGEKYTNYYIFDLKKGMITDNIVSRGETRNYQCKKFK